MTHAECSEQDANRAGPPACPPRSCFLSCRITSSPSHFAPLSLSLSLLLLFRLPSSRPSFLGFTSVRSRVRVSNRFQQVRAFARLPNSTSLCDCRHRVNHSARKNSSGDRVDCYICRCTWTCPIPRLRLVSRVNGPAKRRLTRARVESARATLIECPAKARSLLDNNSPRIKR
jgi:hypothetical protein